MDDLKEFEQGGRFDQVTGAFCKVIGVVFVVWFAMVGFFVHMDVIFKHFFEIIM